MSIKTKIGLLAAAGLISGMLAASPAMAEATKTFGFTGSTTPAFQVVDHKATLKGFTTATRTCTTVGVLDTTGRMTADQRVVMKSKDGKFEIGAPCTIDVTGLVKAPFATAKMKVVGLDKTGTGIYTTPLAPLGKTVGLARDPWTPYAVGHRTGAPWTFVKTAGLVYDPLAVHSGLALYVGAGQPAIGTS